MDNLKILSLWISFILQPVYKGIFLSSSDIFKISTTEDACSDCGYNFPPFKGTIGRPKDKK